MFCLGCSMSCVFMVEFQQALNNIFSFFLSFFYFYATNMFREEVDWCKHWKNLTNSRKMKFFKGYDLLLEPCFNTSWYELRDHVVMQFTIKIEIWSRKIKRGLVGVWHNENLPQCTNTIEMKSNDTMKPVNLW